MSQITIEKTVIEVFVGDLINTEYDAIVIPTNSRMLPSGDLRCEVLRKAGAHVQVECNKIVQDMGNISIGSAVITSGGNLESKYIIHTRAGHDPKKLMIATWNSLRIADENDLSSIVFPPISKEVIGFSTKVCADIMIPTIKKYIYERNNNLANVSFCVKTLPDYKEFENAIIALNTT